MARRAAPAVCALSLEVLASEDDEALGAERRRGSAGVPDRLVVVDAGLELLGAPSVVGHPPQAEEQRNHRDRCSRLIAETPQITSLHCSPRRLHAESLPAL